MNDITLKGRLVHTPDTKFFNGDKSVCNFTIAVNRSFKRDGQPDADFFDCKAFGKTGEFVDKYFKKGQEILLKGEMQRRDWEDKEGNKRHNWECVVAKVEFCGSKTDTGNAVQNTTQQSSGTQEFYPMDESVEDADLPF